MTRYIILGNDRLPEYNRPVFVYGKYAGRGGMPIINSYRQKTDARIHATQKPVELYKWLLEQYAKCKKCDNKGFYYTEQTHPTQDNSRYVDCDCSGPIKILDTHLGSGSIAIACHDYGFHLTACELDKDYFDAAMKRINNHIAQLKIF